MILNECALKKESKTPAQKFVSDVLSILSVVFAALLLSTVITTFFIFTVIVDGDSMYSTLHHGQNVWITKIYTKLDRGDIVIFPWEDSFYKKDEPLIKRVVGVEGDTISLETNENGGKNIYCTTQEGVKTVIAKNFNDYLHLELNGKRVDRILVEPGMVFVMGDNYNNSHDGTEFGPIPASIITGKALFVK